MLIFGYFIFQIFEKKMAKMTKMGIFVIFGLGWAENRGSNDPIFRGGSDFSEKFF